VLHCMPLHGSAPRPLQRRHCSARTSNCDTLYDAGVHTQAARKPVLVVFVACLQTVLALACVN
jgi:hypothetical protein